MTRVGEAPRDSRATHEPCEARKSQVHPGAELLLSGQLLWLGTDVGTWDACFPQGKCLGSGEMPSLQSLRPSLHRHEAVTHPHPWAPRSDLRVALACLTALELVAEQQGAQLAVLVLDVVLDGRLARPAQLVHLLQVVPIHLDLFVVPALRGEGQQRLRVLGGLTWAHSQGEVTTAHCPHSDSASSTAQQDKQLSTVTWAPGH